MSKTDYPLKNLKGYLTNGHNNEYKNKVTMTIDQDLFSAKDS